MTAPVTRCLALALVLVTASACDVTEEKIELWKGTQNGPKKLAGAVIDSDTPIGIRAKAAVALVEINAWDLFRGVFQKMQKTDAEKVIEEVVPVLANLVDRNISKNSLTKIQVDAKDALFILLDYAGQKGKSDAETALVKWCVDDYDTRAMAGQYSVKTIVKKIGPAAADALVSLLSVKELAVNLIAELIREVGDQKTLIKASLQLAKDLKENQDSIKEADLVSAVVIGGDAVAAALVDLATNAGLDKELQRFSLRAFSQGVEKGTVKASDSDIDRLFAMAQSPAYDKHQREETYYVIAQMNRKNDVARFQKLLTDKDAFWRAVGLRCVLRMSGKENLKTALQELARSGSESSKEDIQEIVFRIASFPDLLPEMRELLKDQSVFVRAIVVNVLAEIGNADDAKALGKLTGERKRLPKGFEQETLGKAAQAAVAAIQQRG